MKTNNEMRLEKVDNNTYQFVLEAEKFTRVETVDKKYLKELYEDNAKTLNNYYEQLKRANKELEEMEVFKDEEELKEIKKMRELANKVAKYNEYEKKLEARESMKDFINRIQKQQDDVVKVMPELKRKK